MGIPMGTGISISNGNRGIALSFGIVIVMTFDFLFFDTPTFR